MRISISRPLFVAAVLGLLGLVILQQPRSASAYIYTMVAGAGQHTCALTGTTGVKCWGRNIEGQVGDGTTTRRISAVAVSGLTSGASAIAVGGQNSCALVSGGVKCWGANFFGQIGDGTTGTNRLTPVTVCASGSGGSCTALSGVTALAVGDRHTCAVVSGGVKCWGSNRWGQLGDGTTTSSANPVQVSGLTSGVTAVAAGDEATCALMSAGAVKCWGLNEYGQLGDGTNIQRLTPVAVSGLSGVTRLSVGETFGCAVLSSGNMKCWGYNGVGQLGDTTDTNRSTPVTVCGPGTGACGSLANVVRIATGGAHACAFTLAPAVYCWGWDGFGQLSDGPGAPNFLDYKTRPAQVAGAVAGSNLGGAPYYVFEIGAGAAHSCAVLDPSGWIYCWGWNVEGQLGDGTTTDRPTWAADTDGDGCTDEREVQSAAGTETSGGRRNPWLRWDFFDTPDTTNTTLSTAISASTVIEPQNPATITVGSTSGFAAGSGTLFIDNEKFSYSAMTATTFTLDNRMLDFTTAAQHNTGAVVMSNVRDKKVDSSDVNRVTARYLTSGNPLGDPRLPPPPTGYSTAFDRTSVGPNSWNLGAPDGVINVGDILAINGQSTVINNVAVWHSCQ